MNNTVHDCCAASPDVEKKLDCSQCGQKGQPVAEETIHSLVRPEHIPDDAEGFGYCRTPDCPTVYFKTGHAGIDKGALTVRVGLKETADPVPVCYCFDITRQDIAEEIAATGASTASERITKLMKTDTCDCLHKNPSGRCCLGDVRVVEKELSRGN